MKLIISRNQKEQKGLLGNHKGVTFILSYRVVLDEDERQLISMYKAENEVLTRSENNITTISDAIKGRTQELSNVEILINNEKAIREACKSFKNLLLVMATFGGEEIVEF